MPVIQATDTTQGLLVPTAKTPAAPDAYQNIQTSPSQFGSLEGQATEKLGATVEKLGENFAERAIEQQKQFNATVVEEHNTSYAKKANDLLFGDPDVPGDRGFYGTEGKQTLDARNTVRAALDKLQQDHMGSLQNDAQRLAFSRETLYQRRFIDQGVGSHYRKEMDKWYDQSSKAKFENDKDSGGLNYTSDEAHKNALLGADTRANYEAKGDADIEQALRNKYRDEAEVSRIYGAIAQGDYTWAKTYIESNPNAIKDPKTAADVYTRVTDKALEQDADRRANGLPSTGVAGGGAGWKHPLGAPIANADPYENRLLNEMRSRESSGNYTLVHAPVTQEGQYKGQTAKGAYGFLDDTWKEATEHAGVGKAYASAEKAPAFVQDAVALDYLRWKGTTPWNSSGPYPARGAERSGGSGAHAEIGANDPLVQKFRGSTDQMVADAAKDGIVLVPGALGRTTEEQRQLYANRDPGGAPVAPPGHSQHELGRANDIHTSDGRKIVAGSKEDLWMAAHQANYDIHRPVGGEPWHIEPVGSRPGGTRVTSATQPVRNPQTGAMEQRPRPPAPDETQVAFATPSPGGTMTDAPPPAVDAPKVGPPPEPIPSSTPAAPGPSAPTPSGAAPGAPARVPFSAIPGAYKREEFPAGPMGDSQFIAATKHFNAAVRARDATTSLRAGEWDRAIHAEDQRSKDAFLKRLYPEDGSSSTLTAQEILKAPLITSDTGPIPGGLTEASKVDMIRHIEGKSKPDPMAKVDLENTGRLHVGITSEDPRTQITTMEPIDKAFHEGQITKASYDWLQKQLLDRKNLAGTSDEITRKNYYAVARATLVKDYPGQPISAEGLEKYANWARYADSYISEQRAAGKPMAEIMDLSEKAPLGIMLRQLEGGDAEKTAKGLMDKPPPASGGGFWNWLTGTTPAAPAAAGVAPVPPPPAQGPIQYDANGNRL